MWLLDCSVHLLKEMEVCALVPLDKVFDAMLRNLPGQWRMGWTVTRSGPFVEIVRCVCVLFPVIFSLIPFQFPSNSSSILPQEPFEVEDSMDTDEVRATHIPPHKECTHLMCPLN
jgi:hypothetical protein